MAWSAISCRFMIDPGALVAKAWLRRRMIRARRLRRVFLPVGLNRMGVVFSDRFEWITSRCRTGLRVGRHGICKDG